MNGGVAGVPSAPGSGASAGPGLATAGPRATATVWIDGAAHRVDPSRNLLDVALQLRKDLPFFCWHPALGSVGACRQCAVKQFKDEADTRGRIVMACMTAAADGTRISIDDAEARQFRAGVIEWLMLNHPHDCPVCDEGGECHLQDMTVMSGHVYRRTRFPKRTYRNQDLGPLVNHEMNRCIQCYRCVRYYREYAGGSDLQVFGAHDMLYFGRPSDGTLESPFSGNLVEVCPTGVFTDKTQKRHFTRKWDLATAPSVCVHCGLGCNTIPGERYGALRRIRNRYHGAVNGYFLCDRGRYGYEFVNSDRRIRDPLLPRGRDEAARALSREEMLRRLAPYLEGGKVAGIGSPRASLEANFALRALVGGGRFFRGVPAREDALMAAVIAALRAGPRGLSLRELERCDAVLILGEDVSNTAPLADLAIRQAVRREPERMATTLGIPSWDDNAVREVIQERKGPVYLVTPAPTPLDRAVRRALQLPPEEIARFGYMVRDALRGGEARRDPDPHAPAGEIAAALRDAERPVIVSGTGCGSVDVIRAAAACARSLAAVRPGRPAGIFLCVPEANTMGLSLLDGGNLDDALREAASGNLTTAIVLENDLYRRAARATIARFLREVPHVIVIDHLAHETAAAAEAVLPAATFAESDGTLVNNEGRAQRFFQVFVPASGSIQESWRWIRDLGRAAGRGEFDSWNSLDDVIAAMAAAGTPLAAAREAAPDARFRLAGRRIPRAPHRFSGRTAIGANVDVREAPPPPDPDTFYSFSMEGFDGEVPPAWMPRIWAPGWNSPQALNRYQEEIGGSLRGGDPGVRLLVERDGDQAAAREPGHEPGGADGGMPPPFRARPGLWRLIPLYDVFGSEELSALAPGIMARAPLPALAMNPDDARELGAAEGDLVELSWDLDPAADAGAALRLPLDIIPGLARGTAGWPAGLAGPLAGAIPEWGRIRKP